MPNSDFAVHTDILFSYWAIINAMVALSTSDECTSISGKQTVHILSIICHYDTISRLSMRSASKVIWTGPVYPQLSSNISGAAIFTLSTNASNDPDSRFKHNISSESVYHLHDSLSQISFTVHSTRIYTYLSNHVRNNFLFLLCIYYDLSYGSGDDGIKTIPIKSVYNDYVAIIISFWHA